VYNCTLYLLCSNFTVVIFLLQNLVAIFCKKQFKSFYSVHFGSPITLEENSRASSLNMTLPE